MRGGSAASRSGFRLSDLRPRLAVGEPAIGSVRTLLGQLYNRQLLAVWIPSNRPSWAALGRFDDLFAVGLILANRPTRARDATWWAQSRALDHFAIPAPMQARWAKSWVWHHLSIPALVQARWAGFTDRQNLAVPALVRSWRAKPWIAHCFAVPAHMAGLALAVAPATAFLLALALRVTDGFCPARLAAPLTGSNSDQCPAFALEISDAR